MTTSNLTLPQFLKLKIINMNTFPDQLRVSFNRGINVIYGGNHSGKTTIVNSIKFGVFGLSWDSGDNVETRYFSDKITEIDRKSLEINMVYKIKSITTEVERTVFASGTVSMKSKTSKEEGKSLAISAETFSHEKDYDNALKEYIGIIGQENSTLVPKLIFADENRQTILWTKNLEKFVRRFLTSKETIDRLAMIESQITKARHDIEILNQKREQLNKRGEEKKTFARFLRQSLESIKVTSSDKYIENYKNAHKELNDCRARLWQLNAAIQKELTQRSNLQNNLIENERKLNGLQTYQDALNNKILKAFLDPEDPKTTHFGRYFFHEKKCPFCATDLSEEIKTRVENKKCPVCGQGEMPASNSSMQEINQKLSDIEKEKTKLIDLIKEIQNKITKATDKINTLMTASETERANEITLSERIKQAKVIEETVNKQDVMSKELSDLQIEIQNYEKAVGEISEDIAIVESELEKLYEISAKATAALKAETDTAFGKIQQTFTSFIASATNSELRAELSENLIPTLAGRQIFRPDQVSQFERLMMDCAFRIAVLSVLAQMTKTVPSLVLDTPDEVADEAYIPYLASALAAFSTNLSIIITTVKSDMMERLLKQYQPDDRGSRLIDLISKGTLTQRKYYQQNLENYLSGKR